MPIINAMIENGIRTEEQKNKMPVKSELKRLAASVSASVRSVANKSELVEAILRKMGLPGVIDSVLPDISNKKRKRVESEDSDSEETETGIERSSDSETNADSSDAEMSGEDGEESEDGDEGDRKGGDEEREEYEREEREKKEKISDDMVNRMPRLRRQPKQRAPDDFFVRYE